MKNLLLTFAFLFFTSPAWAVPAFDNATAFTSNGDVSASGSFTTSGSDRLLIVCLTHHFNTGTVTSITYNGVSMGAAVATVVASSYGGTLQMYKLIAPASGTNTFTVTQSAFDEMLVNVMSFTGVHQTTATGTAVTLNSTTSSSSINVTSATNELVVDCMYTENQDPTADGAQTERTTITESSDTLSSSTKPGSGTTTMLWTTGSSGDRGQIGVSLKPLAAPAVTRRRAVIIQ